MFPSRLIRGIDLAIEFATLGEYGLAPEPAPQAPPAFRVDLSGIGGETSASVERLAPSTPAARRLEAARSAAARPLRPFLTVPLPSRSVLRERAFAEPPAERGAPAPRRPGAVPARPQPCLFVEQR